MATFEKLQSSGTQGDQEAALMGGKRDRGCSAHRICCWLFGIIVLIIIALGITALVLYFVLDPKEPKVSVVGATVDYLTVKVTDGSTSLEDLVALATTTTAPLVTIQAALNLTVQVENPNKVTLELVKGELTTLYENNSLANTTVPSFKVDDRSTKLVPAQVVIDEPLSSQLAADFVSDFLEGTVILNTLVNLDGKIEILGISSPEVKVRLECISTVDVETQSLRSNNCKLVDVSI